MTAGERRRGVHGQIPACQISVRLSPLCMCKHHSLSRSLFSFSLVWLITGICLVRRAVWRCWRGNGYRSDILMPAPLCRDHCKAHSKYKLGLALLHTIWVYFINNTSLNPTHTYKGVTLTLKILTRRCSDKPAPKCWVNRKQTEDLWRKVQSHIC